MAIIAHYNMFFELLLLSSRFYKIAGKLDDTISAMNLPDDIREFLISVPDSEKGFYIGALKKNPKLNLDELKQIKPKEKNEEELPHRLVSRIQNYDENFGQWAKIQFRKLKKEYILSNLKKLQDSSWQSVWAKIGENPQDTSILRIFYLKLPEINDWYRAENIQLDQSYSAQRAIELSDAWHKEIAERGKNKGYQEGTSNIVYGPNWQNPEFNGYTIRKVKTANDLDVEGNKMNHCVGSYSDEVDQKTVDVYSLRDPSNNPHVTMGTNFGKYNFFQLKGNSNQPPKQKYKEMIREWFSTLKEIGKTITVSEEDELSDNWEEARIQIKNSFDGVTSYGTEVKPYYEKSNRGILNDFYKLSQNNNQSNDQIVILCADVLHEKDKQLYDTLYFDPLQNKANAKWRILSSIGTNCLSEVMSDVDYKLNRKLDDDLEVPGYPHQNQYSDPEEFGKAVLIWEKKRNLQSEKYKNELIQNVFPFNFYYGLIDELKKVNELDPIPRKPWMEDFYYDRF